jgi:hypothetical protein
MYSNLVILRGQSRINGNVIFCCDYQVNLFDLIEIAYFVIFRQYYKRYLFRKVYKWHQHRFGRFYRFRKRQIFFITKYKKKLPRWILYGAFRIFKSLYPLIHIIKHPTKIFFVQSPRVMASIFFQFPLKFIDRTFPKFMSKKHMKFFSNFCTSLQ